MKFDSIAVSFDLLCLNEFDEWIEDIQSNSTNEFSKSMNQPQLEFKLNIITVLMKELLGHFHTALFLGRLGTCSISSNFINSCKLW